MTLISLFYIVTFNGSVFVFFTTRGFSS